MNWQTVAGISILFFLLGCQNNEPVGIAQGEKKCDHCYMKIVDLRFDSQVKTEKGKRYFFDSIECMGEFSTKTEEKIAHKWVKDFSEPQGMVPASSALFLRSENLPSPMGAYLSAYKSKESLDKVFSEKGGEVLDWAGVMAYLDKRRSAQ